MQSGTSSSLNLSSSSSGNQQMVVRGNPGVAHEIAGSSRSSSVRSVRRSQIKPSKERPSSALARSASRTRVGNPIGESVGNLLDQGTSSVSYQQVNQVWVSQSPDPELVNQAAGAVLQAQTEAHHAQTEAYTKHVLRQNVLFGKLR
jgi:hypothetical protein